MKNNIITTLITILYSNFSFAQNVGIGTNAPHPSSKLEIRSDTSGLLMPRIDSPALRINSPAAGLMVYNSSTNSPNYYNGNAWMNMGCELLQNFKNTRMFHPSAEVQNWVVPQGVTKIWIEGWSNGGGGETFVNPNGEVFSAKGGISGGYGSVLIPVVPGSAIAITVPQSSFYNSATNYVWVRTSDTTTLCYINLYGLSIGDTNDTSVFVYQSVPGRLETNASFSFEQTGASDFRKIIHCGDGASCYRGGSGGKGTVLSVALPSGSVIGYTNGSLDGVPPGGGGAAGYPSGGIGAGGLLIIRY